MAGILKLALFFSLIVLGIIFVPESVIDRMRDAAAGARDYAAQTAARRLPEAKEGIAQQAEETKEDARNLYQKFQEDKWPEMKRWFIDKFIY